IGQLWGQHRNIEKCRISVNRPSSLLFDSRRPWILSECLLCAKSGHSELADRKLGYLVKTF
ncbi:MAG: hypothetical protein KAH64_02015, partial [Nitrosomonadaceae bacterium]|nr:hypothetical protein [Nitrosomonadaceae bacterium]